MTLKTLDLPDALEAAGVVVKVLPDWDSIHKSGTYKWREPDGNPAGHMAHHTATASYTPNRDKASGYCGMGDPNEDNPRLHQVGGSGRVAIYTLANAHPAPISSGYGVRSVLDDYVKKDIPFVGKQTGLDSATWAGNTHYWNTENVLDGIGTAMPQEMWDTYVTVCRVLNDVFGWTSARTIGHGQHTKRKPDLYDGRFDDMASTINALRAAMDDTPPDPGDEDMPKLFKIGSEYPDYEEVTWLIYQLAGGVINVNQNAGSQLDPVLGKTNATLVTKDDINLVADHIGSSDYQRQKLIDEGLYSHGKEIAKLRGLAY